MINFKLSKDTWGFPDASDRKESACNAGDPSLIPGSGRSPGEGYPFHFVASLLTQMVESACNVGDLCSTPGLGRLPGEGNGDPLLTEEPGRLQSIGSQRVRHDEQ